MGSFSRSEPLPSAECLVRLSEKVTIPDGVTLPVMVEVVGCGKGHCLAPPHGPPAKALHDEFPRWPVRSVLAHRYPHAQKHDREKPIKMV